MNTATSGAVEQSPATSGPVPFVDLKLQNQRIADTVASEIAEVLESGAFVLGPKVDAFEQQYAAFCGVDHCVGVGNGTDAIELALRGAGIGRGDEVIIPANTFVATAEAVIRAGASLVLADCDEDFLLDPASVADHVTSRTRGVIAVSLYGQMARIEEIQQAAGSSVLLIEDAAQSQGATRHGKVSGSFGAAAATSFYPGKNLGAYGDAGAVMTSDPEVADQIRAIRNHGGQRRYEHTVFGVNSRLDSIQAAVLSVKLAELPRWNQERREAADRYAQLLGGLDNILLPRVVDGNEHVWHLYVVRVPRREQVIEHLNEAGVGTGIHYPNPVHRLRAFFDLDLAEGSFPVAEAAAPEILSLPMFPGITADQQSRVAETLLQALQK